MTTPSNGSWGEAPEPHYGTGPNPGQPGAPGQSLGQGFDQQQGYPQQPPQQGQHSQQGQHGQHQQGFAPQQPYQQAAPSPAAAGNSIGDLFSDFGFRKGLTESIASIAFIITVIWAVLDFVAVMANAWGSQDFGDTKVKNMGGFEAMMATLSGLVWLVFVVVVARLFFELCINIARMARNRD
ncbi:DUF4282 domain-containing protein [Demetria terragena]|uniref:DUF4282 domain-containing protein n=1 Tax=Demetria terragena TaxID=63959 RepID=UPI0003A54BE0|nr:DUF4282 domain-containing protein [Demetria terragena]